MTISLYLSSEHAPVFSLIFKGNVYRFFMKFGKKLSLVAGSCEALG